MALDRLAHRARVGGEEEGRQMDAPRVERELRAHRAPAPEVGRRLGELRPAERDGGGSGAGAGDEVAARELSRSGFVPHESDDTRQFQSSNVSHPVVNAAPGTSAPRHQSVAPPGGRQARFDDARPGR